MSAASSTAALASKAVKSAASASAALASKAVKSAGSKSAELASKAASKLKNTTSAATSLFSPAAVQVPMSAAPANFGENIRIQAPNPYSSAASAVNVSRPRRRYQPPTEIIDLTDDTDEEERKAEVQKRIDEIENLLNAVDIFMAVLNGALEGDPSTAETELKENLKKLQLLSHPDKQVKLNLNPDEVKQFNNLFDKVTNKRKQYEKLLKDKSYKPPPPPPSPPPSAPVNNSRPNTRSQTKKLNPINLQNYNYPKVTPLGQHVYNQAQLLQLDERFHKFKGGLDKYGWIGRLKIMSHYPQEINEDDTKYIERIENIWKIRALNPIRSNDTPESYLKRAKIKLMTGFGLKSKKGAYGFYKAGKSMKSLFGGAINVKKKSKLFSVPKPIYPFEEIDTFHSHHPRPI
jgi:hypothetical protein